jgi:hypothetical protein
MKLPKGDILLAGLEEHAEAFIIGGSRPIAGPGLIVGRRTGPGERGPALIRLDDVVTMVRWTSIGVRPKPPRAMRAIVIDPEQGLIEEVVIAPHKLAIASLLGGEIGPYMRVPGNDHVLTPAFGPRSPWYWRKDDLAFSARCVAHRGMGPKQRPCGTPPAPGNRMPGAASEGWITESLSKRNRIAAKSVRSQSVLP